MLDQIDYEERPALGELTHDRRVVLFPDSFDAAVNPFSFSPRSKRGPRENNIIRR